MASGYTPETAAALVKLRAALAARGFTFGEPISGFRTYEDQRQLYENYLAGRAGRPLPYPERGAVALAARPGHSMHEFGKAFDTGLHGAALAAANELAPGLGLTTVAGDPGHFQLATTAVAANAPSVDAQPVSAEAPVGTTITSTSQPFRPATPTPGPTLFGGLNADARGMRNNNPGNLVASDWVKSLPGYKGDDGKFAIFDTPEHGAAALDANLKSYGRKGINTPLGIASTWAPASDNNNPDSYGGQIAKALGVGPNDKIDMGDPSVRAKVSQAIGMVENGPGKSTGVRVAYGGTADAPAAPAVAAAPTTNMGPAPGGAAPPEFAKTPVGKSLDELAKAMTPDQQQQQPQFLNLPSSARNVSPYLGGQGALGSGQSMAGAQVQQALGYQPTPVYGTGITSLPPSWSGATPGSPTQNQPQFGGFGPQTSPYGTSIGSIDPMLATMLQRQQGLAPPQGAADPYGGFGYG